jgi:hypothetical protein
MIVECRIPVHAVETSLQRERAGRLHLPVRPVAPGNHIIRISGGNIVRQTHHNAKPRRSVIYVCLPPC